MRVSRRGLLKSGLVVGLGLVGSRVLANWLPPSGEGDAIGESGATAVAASYDPTDHAWAFVCDTTTCIGCGLCVEACKLENHVPQDPELNRTWVELHLVAEDGAVYVGSRDGDGLGFPPDTAVAGSAGATVRQSYFVPRLCMQCDNPPCTSVCPVSATYKTEDGVVLVDAGRCIGCGYCVVACPYGARYMVPAGEAMPMDTPGVADKCTFCYHRITRGQQPACAEVCPVGARIFGDLDDATSPVRVALHDERVRVMKPALGTKPRVYYIGLEGEVE